MTVSSNSYKPGFPRYVFNNGGASLIVYEILLKRMGTMPEAVSINATVDLSTQYRAEGKQWRAETTGGGFRPGNRVPAHRVAGWRELSQIE